MYLTVSFNGATSKLFYLNLRIWNQINIRVVKISQYGGQFKNLLRKPQLYCGIFGFYIQFSDIFTCYISYVSSGLVGTCIQTAPKLPHKLQQYTGSQTWVLYSLDWIGNFTLFYRTLIIWNLMWENFAPVANFKTYEKSVFSSLFNNELKYKGWLYNNCRLYFKFVTLK